MKIGKIILLVLAAAVIALSIKGIMDVPGRKSKLENAVELDKAACLPENEGKIVIVRGVPEMTAPAYDDHLGITINSVKAIRQKEVYEETGKSEEKYEWKWTVKATETLLGQAKLGEFTLDKSVLNVFPVETEYEDFDSFEVRAYNLSRGKNANGRIYVMPYGGYYYDEEVIEPDSSFLPGSVRAMWDREGTEAYHYRAFDYGKMREMTVVAVQKGDTLVAPDKLGAIVKTGAVSKDKIVSSDAAGTTIAAVIGLILGLVLTYFGLRKPAPRKTNASNAKTPKYKARA
jgi:hypothetical protein